MQKVIMDKNTLEFFKKLLLEKRAYLFKGIRNVEQDLQGIIEDRPTESIEKASGESDLRILSKLDDLGIRELREIDVALAKIDAGTYGVCEGCGKPIPEARLRALPSTSLCSPCKHEEEEGGP